MTKTAIALATAFLIGVASAAYAAGRDDADHNGGFRVGPLGQDFGTGVNPVDHPSIRGAYGYAYQAPGQRNKRHQSR